MKRTYVPSMPLGGKYGALRVGLCAFAFATTIILARAQGGFAGTVTGGAGGPTVTVSTLAALTTAIGDDVPRVVNVSGTINLGSANARFGSNKTIQGVGTNSGFIGNLKGVEETNVIIQRLNFTNPSGVGDADGVGLEGCTRIWIDHCSFVDCGDGSLDIKRAADNITVSWCKFSYTFDSGHNFVNLIGHSDGNGSQDTGRLHITMHHNWYSTLCKERMPRVRFGQVHVYNNYYGSAGSNYNVGIGNNSQVLIENCYFDAQAMPWKNYSSSGNQGLVRWNAGNVFVNTTIPSWAPNSSAVFTPPYSYSLESGSSVKTSVMAGAGSGGGATTPAPAAPSNLAASATSSSQINLTWTDNANNETGFVVERATNSAFSAGLVSSNVGANVQSFSATGLAASTTYFFRVRATNSGGSSGNSNTASAATPPGTGGTSVTIQAEAGAVGGGTTIDNNNAGFNGTGFANFPASGGSLQFNSVDGGTGGNRTLAIRFALGITSSRTGQLLINGVARNVTFAPTGAWTTWVTMNVSIPLNSGTGNTIRFQSNGQDMGNIDQITVSNP
jgi:pectate lyase